MKKMIIILTLVLFVATAVFTYLAWIAEPKQPALFGPWACICIFLTQPLAQILMRFSKNFFLASIPTICTLAGVMPFVLGLVDILEVWLGMPPPVLLMYYVFGAAIYGYTFFSFGKFLKTKEIYWERKFV